MRLLQPTLARDSVDVEKKGEKHMHFFFRDTLMRILTWLFRRTRQRRGCQCDVPSHSNSTRHTPVGAVLNTLSRNVRYLPSDIQARRIAEALRTVASRQKPTYHPKMRVLDVKEIQEYELLISQKAAEQRRQLEEHSWSYCDIDLLHAYLPHAW